jgi:hypothetical protein
LEDPFELPRLLELLRLLEPLLEPLDAFGLLRELVACLLRELADLPLELFALLFELLALLREFVALLFDALPRFDDELPLFDDALPLGLEPFELREVVFRLVDEPELAWAINPSLSRCPADLEIVYPDRWCRNALGTRCQLSGQPVTYAE